MRSTLIAYVLAGILAVDAAVVPVVEKRQAKKKTDEPVICVGPGGRVDPVPGAAPLKQVIPTPNMPKGSQRIKMRHGPYSVPGMMYKSVMGESGALWNCGDAEIEKPCEECTLFRLQAGLEYPNGTNANIDSGMWLHHMVLLNVGPGRWDPTCYGNKGSLPHLAVGTYPTKSERMFASGNERTAADITSFIRNGKKVGYAVKKTDDFRFIVDLMNMNMVNVTVYLTMTYDLIDGPQQEGWEDLFPVWLDADQCGMSDVHPPDPKGKFTISSKAWQPNLEGQVVGMGTHLHDGGDVLRVLVNETTMACNSVAKYGETPEYIYKAPAKMHGDVHVAEKHISTMSTCYYEDVGVKHMSKDQTWLLKGDYDYTKHDGNSEDGEASEIMAISIVYVAQPQGRTPPPSS